MARRGTKLKRPKQVNVRLIPRLNTETGEVAEVYAMLDDMIDQHHPHLRFARIAIAWREGWMPDRDGRLKLGQARKASDLDRELKDYDFVILLNGDAWFGLLPEQRLAIIDHEAMHCQIALDDNGDPKVDSRGRNVYRLRGHDVEEFRDIIHRHGVYKQDLEAFAKVMMDRYKTPLFDRQAKPEAMASAARSAAGEELHDASWRTVLLNTLGLPAGVLKSLDDAELHTVGDVADFTASGTALTEIEGVGPAKAEKIEAALADFWARQQGQAKAEAS